MATTQKRAAVSKSPARAKSGTRPSGRPGVSVKKSKPTAKKSSSSVPARKEAKASAKSSVSTASRKSGATSAVTKGKGAGAGSARRNANGSGTDAGKTASGRKSAAPVAPARPAEPVRARKPIFSAPERQKYRKLLLKERSELVSDKESREREALKAAGPDFSVDHMADYGSDNYEQEFTLGLLEKDVEKLRDIDEALLKLEDGTFGLCEDCEEKIPVPRLDVIPYARLCIKCKMKEE